MNNTWVSPPPFNPLFITNLDQTITHESLFAFFSKFGPIQSLSIVEESDTINSSRCAYIKFLLEIHAEAALIQAQYERLGEKNIRIRVSRDIRDLLFETAIFIKNIPPNAAVMDLCEHFSRAGVVSGANIDNGLEGKTFGCGYVHFAKREDAERALNELQGMEFMGSKLEFVSFFPGRHKRKPVMKDCIHIKELPQGKNVEELKKILSETLAEYGRIKNILIQEHEGNKGYSGTVYFQEDEDSQAAYNDLSRRAKEYSGLEGQLCIIEKDEEDNKKVKEPQKKIVKNEALSGSDSDDVDPFYQYEGSDGRPKGLLSGVKPFGNTIKKKSSWRRPKEKQAHKINERTLSKGQKHISHEEKFDSKREGFNENDVNKQKGIGALVSHVKEIMKQDMRSEILRPINKQKQLEKEEEIAWMAESQLGMTYEKFMRYSKDKQKEKLAQTLFPRIRAIVGDALAPRVTGMLSDPSLYELEDILWCIEDKGLLEEKVKQIVEETEKK